MFKKFSNGILIIILAVLMIIYLIVRYSGSDERTFRDKVLSFDAVAITQILISDPKTGPETVDLRKSGDKWTIKSGSRDYSADTNIVNNMLLLLSDLPTKRYAGRGADAWVKYEVTDTSGILVTLKTSDKAVAEIYIGKFSYNIPKEQQQQLQSRQPRGEMTSFVRLADEKDVYAVDGFLKMNFNSNVDSYRNRSLIAINPTDINRIIVSESGNRSVFENQGGNWVLNGMPADSASMATYCNTIARLSGSKFAEQEGMLSAPTHTLIIEGNNFNPVEIAAYPVADTNVNYITTSSANPGSFFNGKEGGLFEKITSYPAPVYPATPFLF